MNIATMIIDVGLQLQYLFDIGIMNKIVCSFIYLLMFSEKWDEFLVWCPLYHIQCLYSICPLYTCIYIYIHVLFQTTLILIFSVYIFFLSNVFLENWSSCLMGTRDRPTAETAETVRVSILISSVDGY